MLLVSSNPESKISILEFKGIWEPRSRVPASSLNGSRYRIGV